MQPRLQRIVSRLDQLAELSGRAVSWLTLGMVLLTLIVVILRYLFDIGSIALQESITYLHAVVFMLGAAYIEVDGCAIATPVLFGFF